MSAAAVCRPSWTQWATPAIRSTSPGRTSTCEPGRSFVTGTVMVVDGGMTI